MKKAIIRVALCFAGAGGIIAIEQATNTPPGWYTYVMCGLWGFVVSRIVD